MKTGEINYIDEIKRAYNRSGLDASLYDFEAVEGRGRYTKIVSIYKLQGARAAAAFIDKQTGFMYWATSWSKPAKTRIC